MGTTVLQDLSAQLHALVETAGHRIVCAGTGAATPRSGILIGNGEVVTVAREAQPDEHVPIHHGDTAVSATVKGFDPASGIALLVHRDLEAPSLDGTPGTGALPAVGSLTVTVASPIPGDIEARLGMIRCVGGETRLAGGRRIDGYFQTDAGRFRGFSGSAVFGPTGEVLGMTMPGRRREEGFVIPTGALLEIVAQLREGGSLGTGYLGIQATAVDLPQEHDGYSTGLLVVGVEPDSPAQRAGIQVGAFVVKVGDHRTPTIEALYDSLLGVRDQEPLPVAIVRPGVGIEVITVEVVHRR